MAKIIKREATTVVTTEYEVVPEKPGDEEQIRMLTVSSRERGVPFLSITGKWFAKAGFMPGDKVIVKVRDGEVVLCKAAEQAVSEQGL